MENATQYTDCIGQALTEGDYVTAAWDSRSNLHEHRLFRIVKFNVQSTWSRQVSTQNAQLEPVSKFGNKIVLPRLELTKVNENTATLHVLSQK